MKILAYLVAFALTVTIGVLISSIVTFLPTMFHAYLYKKVNGFWESFISGGLECLVLISLSMWAFSWFGFQITLLYVLILTVGILQNNIYRIKTRPNYDSELGYLVSQLFGFIIIYLSFLKADLITFNFL